MDRYPHKPAKYFRTFVLVAGFALGYAATTVYFSGRAPHTAAQKLPDTAMLAIESPHCVDTTSQQDTNTTYPRALMEYSIPDLYLTNLDNQLIPAKQALDRDGPVMLNFIFTTCSTICPILSATFSQVRTLLGDEAAPIRFISISIDPEHDTPSTLRAYAKKYHADSNWQFFTGELENIVTLQRAFDAYRGNKMSHRPVTFIRTDSHKPWLRIEGFPKAQDLVREYRTLDIPISAGG